MRFLLDEHLPRSAVQVFEAAGLAADTAEEEGLDGAPDERVWEAVLREDWILVTCASAFADRRLHRIEGRAGVVVLRLRSCARGPLLARLAQVLALHETFPGYRTVVGERGVRQCG